MHTFLVAAQFVIVQVVYDDIVRACFTVAQTTRGLSASAGKELYSVGGLEFPLLPRGVPLLLAEVGNDSLVMLQFRLYVSQQTSGGILTLADHHHEIDEPFGLEHQPQRNKDVHVCGFA